MFVLVKYSRNPPRALVNRLSFGPKKKMENVIVIQGTQVSAGSILTTAEK